MEGEADYRPVFSQTRWPNLHLDDEWQDVDAYPLVDLDGRQAVLDLTLSDTTPVSRKSKLALYATYSLAAWGWRTWEFAVAFILLRLNPNSLLLVAIYGILDSGGRMILGPAVGAYLDRSSRLWGASAVYILQNVCIGASAACASVVIVFQRSLTAESQPAGYWTLVGLTMLLGSLSGVGSMGIQIALEKEWVKVLCGLDSTALSRINAGFRAVDLSCLMLGPMASGFLMTYAGLGVAVLVLGAYNMLMWMPELLLLKLAVDNSVNLRQPKILVMDGTSSMAGRLGLRGWPVYARQVVVLPCVSLALLYLTVLSLGFLMTAYVRQHGWSEVVISVFRAGGAISGLLATLLFPALHSCMGLKATGMAGITWQLFCLAAGAAPLLLRNLGMQPLSGQVAVAALLGGVVLSRTGLWLYDLSVSQMMQEYVNANELGSVSGVQGSLQSGLEILSFVAGSAAHQPSQFHWLVMMSLASVGTAAVNYYAYLLRGERLYHELRTGGSGVY